VPNEFYDDKTLFTSHETPFFSLLDMSVKIKIFNVIKLFMKLPFPIETGLTRPDTNIQ